MSELPPTPAELREWLHTASHEAVIAKHLEFAELSATDPAHMLELKRLAEAEMVSRFPGLVRDSARLDWIERGGSIELVGVVGCVPSSGDEFGQWWRLERDGELITRVVKPSTLREAIDAASQP